GDTVVGVYHYWRGHSCQAPADPVRHLLRAWEDLWPHREGSTCIELYTGRCRCLAAIAAYVVRKRHDEVSRTWSRFALSGVARHSEAAAAPIGGNDQPADPSSCQPDHRGEGSRVRRQMQFRLEIRLVCRPLFQRI